MRSNPDFDETDLNVILMAISHKLETTKWNVNDEVDWEQLVVLKSIQARIERNLDGE